MNIQDKEAAERFQLLADKVVASSTPQLLRGTIKNLRKTRTIQDFMFTQEDRNKMGAGAIIAAAEGLSGLAVGLAGSAFDTSEEADLLEFEINNKPIRAWVWASVFSEGDEVEIVAESMGKKWQAYGIRRVSDHILALHPHCSRGRYAHYKTTLYWLIKTYIPLFAISFLISFYFILEKNNHIDYYDLISFYTPAFLLSFSISGIIAWRIARKYKGFVELAERIFTVFGWKDVKNIDLPAITKKNKKPGDPAALGTLFFRY